MSKKHKIKKKIVPGPVESSAEKFPAVKKTITPEPATGFRLIHFDRRTKIFIAALLLFYVLVSSLKIHTSNIGNWDIYFGDEKSDAVLAGEPKFIRMDEWMITTPAVLGQYEQGLPLKNQANGGGNTPVVFGLPLKDVSSVLRPAVWSYFIFDIERAFAFSWNFNIFFFLISMFLLLMLLTKNNFWLSVVGTFFIFLAPGIQWWSYTLSTYMMHLNGIVLSFIYLLYSKKVSALIISSLILILSVFSFIAHLYPPFQIPLVYLYLAILIGWFVRERKFTLIKEKLKLKITISGIAIILMSIILFHYYNIAKNTYGIMMNTVYPGKRFTTGGDLINGKLFADFFGMFMSDKHTPEQWQNICEASGAFMFFPVIFYALSYYYFKYKRADSVLISISVFLLVSLVYVLAGFPAFLSKLTLFSMSPSFRTLPILGIGNCILLIGYLGSIKMEVKKPVFSWIETGILAVVCLLFIRIVSSYINKSTENFFTANEVNITTLFVVLSYLLIRFKDLRFARPALYSLLIIMVIPNIGINPITKGLSPLLENPLTQTSKEIRKKDPEAGWALFGNDRLANLLKASGVNILNGVKYVPDMEVMKVLDPGRKRDSIYNRYAWITMKAHIDGKDTVIIRQTFNDGYTIFMDPCSPKFKKLGVKYFVFDYTPQQAELRCMTKQAQIGQLTIYKRNDF